MQDAGRRGNFANIHEAVKEHRLSIMQRPKSAGTDRSRGGSPLSRRSDKTAPRSGKDLRTIVRTIEITSGLETFVFPTPSPLPVCHAIAIPPPPQSPEHAGPLSPSGIGIAIGSPSQMAFPIGVLDVRPHVSAPAVRPSTSHGTGNSTRSTSPMDSLPIAPNAEGATLSRKKSLGWKAFSNIFRKPTRSAKLPILPVPQDKRELRAKAQAVYDCSPAQTIAASPPPPYSRAATSNLPPTRISSMNHLPGLSRVSVLDQEKRLDSVSIRARDPPIRPIEVHELPVPLPRLIITDSDSDHDKEQSVGDDARADSPLADAGYESPRTPKIELDLPSPSLERYSVMFQGLFGRDERDRTTLVGRRQSKPKQLTILTSPKDFADPMNKIEITPVKTGFPRKSLTSPHILSLIIADDEKTPPAVATDAQNSPVDPRICHERPRLMHRSNTAPAGATSPVSGIFARTTTTTTARIPKVIVESPLSVWSASFSHDSSMPSTPISISARSDASSVAEDGREPVWEMLTSVLPRGMDTPPPEPKSPVAQLSTARRVSVSHTMHHSLGRISVHQPLRPRVVELNRNRKSTIAALEMVATA